jgi:hypothetical protein
MTESDVPGVWIFVGEYADFPSGAFTSYEKAREWIKRNRVSGVVTWYPLDEGTYEWAIRNDIFAPKRPDQETPGFIGRFSSAAQDHYHFYDGKDNAEDFDRDAQAIASRAERRGPHGEFFLRPTDALEVVRLAEQHRERIWRLEIVLKSDTDHSLREEIQFSGERGAQALKDLRRAARRIKELGENALVVLYIDSSTLFKGIYT